MMPSFQFVNSLTDMYNVELPWIAYNLVICCKRQVLSHYHPDGVLDDVREKFKEHYRFTWKMEYALLNDTARASKMKFLMDQKERFCQAWSKSRTRLDELTQKKVCEEKVCEETLYEARQDMMLYNWLRLYMQGKHDVLDSLI
jgi:hypothetical protein